MSLSQEGRRPLAPSRPALRAAFALQHLGLQLDTDGLCFLRSTFQVCDTHYRNGTTVIDDVFLRAHVSGPT